MISRCPEDPFRLSGDNYEFDNDMESTSNRIFEVPDTAQNNNESSSHGRTGFDGSTLNGPALNTTGNGPAFDTNGNGPPIFNTSVNDPIFNISGDGPTFTNANANAPTLNSSEFTTYDFTDSHCDNYNREGRKFGRSTYEDSNYEGSNYEGSNYDGSNFGGSNFGGSNYGESAHSVTNSGDFNIEEIPCYDNRHSISPPAWASTQLPDINTALTARGTNEFAPYEQVVPRENDSVTELAAQLTTAAMSNIFNLDANLTYLYLKQKINSQEMTAENADYFLTVHANPVSEVGQQLLDNGIESKDVSKISSIEELQLYRTQLQLALDTQKQRQDQAEREASAYRMHMVEVARYLAVERETMEGILSLASYRVEPLLSMQRRINQSRYLQADKQFCDFMNRLGSENPHLHLRMSNNLAEAWDNAAGLIEVMREDIGLLQARQERDATAVGVAIGYCTRFARAKDKLAEEVRALQALVYAKQTRRYSHPTS